MDLFTRFNRKAIDDRQIDTLIGLAKGILADGVVNQAEAAFLHKWLVQSRQTTSNPIVINLLQKLDAIFEDGAINSSEAKELVSVLSRFAGDESEFGELAKPTSLPLDVPPPSVTFQSRLFLFTGTCAFGTRKQCQKATEALGGAIAQAVTKRLNYLVVGTYVTDSWIHETFGRKIEKAVAYRSNGVPLAIISEEKWANDGSFVA